MAELWPQVLLIAAGGLLGSGGGLAVWLQSRASRAAGVTSANVERDKSSGQLALDVAVHVTERMRAQDERIDALVRETAHQRRRVSALETELRAVLEEVESIARDLRRLVLWDEAGRQGPPPVNIADLHERLAALTTRNGVQDD